MPNVEKPPSDREHVIPLWLLTTVWGIAIVIGYSCLLWYNMNPGQIRIAPNRWPDSCSKRPDQELPTLLVFIHPKCPCTQATLIELEKLLAETNGKVRCNILLCCPSRLIPEWISSSLVERCCSIEGVIVDIDMNGALATTFNATSSGLCLLYSTAGELQFHGGLTSERGHIGESIGRDAIRKILRNDVSYVECSPVFGCELVQLNRNCEAEPAEHFGAQ